MSGSHGPKARVETDGHVASIVLADPPLHRIGAAMVRDLGSALDAVLANADVRVVVLRAEGEAAFSVGADLKEDPASVQGGDIGAFHRLRTALFERIERSSKPVVASIAGHCLGGGLELALACHFRVAGSGARFSLPEIRLGLIPAWGGVQRVARTIGRAAALDLLLRGCTMDAAQALSLGLVSEVTEEADPVAAARALAEELAARPPLAVAAILASLDPFAPHSASEAIDRDVDRAVALGLTEDCREGLAAFLERRAPRFVGR